MGARETDIVASVSRAPAPTPLHFRSLSGLVPGSASRASQVTGCRVIARVTPGRDTSAVSGRCS
jgi:hypothetical protein